LSDNLDQLVTRTAIDLAHRALEIMAKGIIGREAVVKLTEPRLGTDVTIRKIGLTAVIFIHPALKTTPPASGFAPVIQVLREAQTLLEKGGIHTELWGESH
jgi:hypothetical protein